MLPRMFPTGKRAACPAPTAFRRNLPVVLAPILIWGAAAGLAQIRPHAGMMRYPDVSESKIVFVYANDIWLAPIEGGVAEPLASPPGEELFPRFSPDGKQVAFVGNYDGNRDLYVLPVDGGTPTRVTHHPYGEVLSEWTGEGRLIFYVRGAQEYPRAVEMFTVSAAGGLPEKLPIPYGANGTISLDGTWLAYTLHTRDARTWKRYRGGMATDIWLFNLKDNSSRKITDWEGTDTLPMWHGEKVYYLSDAGPEHRLNVWVYDTQTRQRRQITSFADYDVKWPAIGPGPGGRGAIVFQHGADLRVLDLASGESRVVEITIPGDRPQLRPQRQNAADLIEDMHVSKTGKRAVASARGDIWTLPARNGTSRNLTQSSGVAERDPAWSPDGRWIAYFSDKSGEYELYMTQSDGAGETKQLTTDLGATLRADGQTGGNYYYMRGWSPDSKHIAFGDKAGGLYVHTVDGGETKRIDVEPWSGAPAMSWSHDSDWIAYTKGGPNRLSAIWLYQLSTGEKHQVTTGMFADTWPTFDRKGEYLYFASNRDFSGPVYEDVGTTFVYADTDRLLVVPLRADVKNPLAPKSDEEEWDEDEKKDKNGEDADDEDDNGKDENGDDDNGDGSRQDDSSDDAQDSSTQPTTTQAAEDDEEEDEEEDEKEDEKPEPLKIDLEGFEARAMLLPVDRGSFSNLTVNNDGHLVYVRAGRRGGGGETEIKILDLSADDKEEKTVLSGTGNYVMSADGKKLLVRRGNQSTIIDAKAGQKFEKPISTDDLRPMVDPREEWAQVLREAWRVQRDFFYDPYMHRVDWDGVYEQYASMLPDCVSRNDVTYIIRELISELNVGHAYYFGGDTEDQPSVSVGMPGCDFELVDGSYRIKRIVQAAPWDTDARSPLARPDLDVKAGDYLLAVNGVPVDTTKDPWAAFQGLAGKTVTLTVSSKPEIDDEARRVVVELLRDEGDLRFRAWVEKNRAYVAAQTDGAVGYIYVPDTGRNGQNELFRQFYGQVDRQALIVDERWNGGGQIPTRFIELLNRPATNMWARRDGQDWIWPPDAHQGPKCMLINGLAGSGGDCFPFYFRQAGIGKLIGTRTWGGLVGISGNPRLIDGGYTSAPTFAFYEMDGTWGIEGHGVDPDIEVIDDPAKMVGGKDPQLDTAIKLMLDEISTRGFVPPKRPAYPDRKGMGIREEDK